MVRLGGEPPANLDDLDPITRAYYDQGLITAIYHEIGDEAGYWEIRALPDGPYRVEWDPQTTEPDWPTYLPRRTLIRRPDPLITELRVIAIVEIRDANRVLNVNFGVAPQLPVPGAVGAPNTGSGPGGGGTGVSVLIAGLALSALAALGLTVRSLRRRSG